mmetsp:Transcript_2226/g.6495  ORF Transcript_2226/g.6495 Transcript_2226/m.6495 type:complete len:271 (-) Transcript_2226:100-912(-)
MLPILEGLGVAEGRLVGPQERIQTRRVAQLGMDGDPTQKQLQIVPALLDEGRGEARHGLLLGNWRDDGPGPLPVQPFVQPVEVGIPPQHRRVGRVLEDGILHPPRPGHGFRRTDVDAVRGELRHAVLVLDGIRHGDVQGGIFRPTAIAGRNDRDGRGRKRRGLHRLDDVRGHLLLGHLHLRHLRRHHHVLLHLLRRDWRRRLLRWHRRLLSDNRRSLLWDLLLLGHGCSGVRRQHVCRLRNCRHVMCRQIDLICDDMCWIPQQRKEGTSL